MASSLSGLTVVEPRSSGQQITQGGNNRVKRALMLAADAARRIDPDLAEIYWRLMTTKGHHHKQALCAVANRLANRIFSVLRQWKALPSS